MIENDDSIKILSFQSEQLCGKNLLQHEIRIKENILKNGLCFEQKKNY